jgi:pre-rRNA-processing protein TSR3
MPSSGSIRTRSTDGPIRLYLFLAREDHPKACTGRRLIRQRLALPLGGGERAPIAPLLLDPYVAEPLCGADRPRAKESGILGVDCSWNRLNARNAYPDLIPGGGRRAHRRRLPILLAANPQHFGRVAQLNTAEAFAAALAVLGEPERARELLQLSPGGGSFLSLNELALQRYVACTTAEDIRAAERDLF